MTRTQLFQELADILTLQLGRPYSDEIVTDAQLDAVSDAILLRFQQIKKETKCQSEQVKR